MNPTSPEDLDSASRLILAETPADFLPAPIAASLRTPTNLAIREATAALVAGGRSALADRIYELFWDRTDLGPWARYNRARQRELAGEPAGAISILTEAIAVFPQRAVPHWWITRARCEHALGLAAAAEATLREAVARFPDSSGSLAALADRLARDSRPAEAARVWREAIDRFPGEMQVHWYTGLYATLRAAHRLEEAHAAAEEMARVLPDDPQALAGLARSVAERHDWPRALDLWTRCGQRHPAIALDAATGRARALFKLWRIEEALEIWRELIASHPNFWPGWRDLAVAAFELRDDPLTERCLETLIERFPDQSRPEWWSTLARCLNDRREYAAAEARLSELERRFPDSPLARRERIRNAAELEYGQDEISLLVEDAVRAFPDDPELLREQVNIALGFGQWERAAKIVAALEALGPERVALATGLMVEAERDGDSPMIPRVASLIESRTWTLDDGMPIAGFLMGLASRDAYQLALRLLDDLAARYPRDVRLVRALARSLIALRLDERALGLIDEIPAPFQGDAALELRAWAAARRGRDREAKDIWATILATRYFPAAHYRVEGLERLTPERGARDGVTAYIIYRNEAPQIANFLAHHRRIGVGRFVFIDHESDDGSRELLMDEPDVTLYRCADSYQLSSSGRRWMKELIDREGGRGWSLQVDADEAFIYPGWETLPIERFTQYLDAQGFEGVRAFMLDVFPRHLLDTAGQPTPIDRHRYYDGDYVWLGQARAPYLVPSGGVRERLFGAREDLHKTPLWRVDSGTVLNSHEISHIRIADVSGALLHYKLYNVALRGRGARRESDGPAFLEPDSSIRVMRRHSRYAARLAAAWRADLFTPGVSAELTDSLILADRGLMDAPARYREWIGG